MKRPIRRSFISGFVLAWLMLLAACQPQVAPPPTVDPQTAVRRQQERAALPAVTTVQKWQAISNISQPENNAPSIIPLDNGDYRMYWNAPSLNGIGSATTPDGLRFNTDDKARLINAPAGQPDCSIGKPWVIPVVNGYRMYYQGQPDNCLAPLTGITTNARIFSAFSSDGQSFERDPGIRIDVGDVTGLSAAGHGRVIQTDDGSFRMYFTALLPDKGTTPYIMTAVSIDTLAWVVDPRPLLENAHDPTALQVENTINMYVTFMTENTLLLQSTDGGVTFTPTAWLEFYDSQNELISGMVDVDIIDISDGSLVMYGSGANTGGIWTFKQAAP
ncbi:MAG: hypothetical protein GC179_06645 [Anaerolineaceae bacterium]|nr:hypothetical protein [Anaerolineaceae bacterium]